LSKHVEGDQYMWILLVCVRVLLISIFKGWILCFLRTKNVFVYSAKKQTNPNRQGCNTQHTTRLWGPGIHSERGGTTASTGV